MQRHVLELARLLRQNGVRISTVEITDAVRAVAAVGVGDAEHLRLALASTLIKSAVDQPTFDELFELYFRRRWVLDEAVDSEFSAAARQAGADEAEIAPWPKPWSRALLRSRPPRAWASAVGAPEMAALLQRAAGEVALGDIRTPLQVGYYGYRMAEAMGLAEAEAEALSSSPGWPERRAARRCRRGGAR